MLLTTEPIPIASVATLLSLAQPIETQIYIGMTVKDKGTQPVPVKGPHLQVHPCICMQLQFPILCPHSIPGSSHPSNSYLAMWPRQVPDVI